MPTSPMAAMATTLVPVDTEKRDMLADELERARLARLFHSLDLNQDGKVDPEELAEGLQRQGYGYVTKEQIEEFLLKSDVSRTGDLDLAEFVEYLVQHERQLHFVFSSLDENKDGKLCVPEIIKAFKKMGIVISEDEATRLRKRINANDNSLDISYEEWRDFLLFHPSTELYDIIQSWRHNTSDYYCDCFDFAPPDRGEMSVHIQLTDPLEPSSQSSTMLLPEILDFGDDIGVPDDFSDQEIISGMWWRHLVAGGIAGAVSRTCTAPLDRLKIILQVHGGRKSLRIFDTVRYMLNEGGFAGLWRGNGMNVIKIAPESALKFGAYDFIKRLIRGDQDRDLQLYERFMAGSLAGGFSQSVIYPLEVMKTRMALRKTHEYRGIFDCAKQLYTNGGGIKVFYRGYVPNLLGILPYAGIDLAVYETLKRRYLSEYHTDGSAPPAVSLLAFGTFSSCCGQVAAYPLALVRTKLQSQAGLNLKLPEEQTHAVGLFRYILRTEGPRGLYRGIIPNFCKVAPAVSISYYVYERSREYLGVEMI